MSRATPRHEYHEGERSVQERAGVTAEARALARSILPFVPEAADQFLGELPFVIAGAPDERGAVWASILTGAPGFLHRTGPTTVEIAARFAEGDPLAPSSPAGGPSRRTGLLGIELATQRRVRLNGQATFTDAGLRLALDEFYGNCPQHIRPREVTAGVPQPAGRPGSVTPGSVTRPGSVMPGSVVRSGQLSPAQVAWIGAADTFFLATLHPTRGADASHRGGEPGFVTVRERSTLVWPDFPGNNMFNTLGNLASDPRAGLLFLDFERGRTLQLTGEAEVVWDPRDPALAGEARGVRFKVSAVVENAAGTSLRWASPGAA